MLSSPAPGNLYSSILCFSFTWKRDGLDSQPNPRGWVWSNHHVLKKKCLGWLPAQKPNRARLGTWVQLA
jgi:hypothetical protein